jgi:hypothetical protein
LSNLSPEERAAVSAEVLRVEGLIKSMYAGVLEHRLKEIRFLRNQVDSLLEQVRTLQEDSVTMILDDNVREFFREKIKEKERKEEEEHQKQQATLLLELKSFFGQMGIPIIPDTYPFTLTIPNYVPTFATCEGERAISREKNLVVTLEHPRVDSNYTAVMATAKCHSCFQGCCWEIKQASDLGEAIENCQE